VAPEHVVLDASAWIDLLRQATAGGAVRDRLKGRVLHAPAHVDAELLSVLGRLHRAGALAAAAVATHLGAVAAAPVTRHDVGPLLEGAWKRRHELRLADALYVELADGLGARLVTTDQRLGRATSIAEVVGS